MTNVDEHRINGASLIESIWHDLRYGVRMLGRSPGSSGAAVLTLAIGIGACTAVFSVANAILLQPLPFHDPQRIVMLWERNPELDYDYELAAGANFVAWRDESKSFEELGFVTNWTTLTRNFVLETNDAPIRVRGRYVSSGMFRVLGVAPIHGRVFQAEEDQIGGERAVILSHRLWQRVYEGDPNVVGKTMRIGQGDAAIFGPGGRDEGSYLVLGVMPAGFAFPPDAELWLSWSGFGNESWMRNHSRHPFWAIGRLKPDVTAAQAQAELNVIQARIHKDHPEAENLASHVRVVPLLEQVVGSSTRPALLTLLGAVGFVLLIACANVANLLLARGTARQKEIAIRAALGAGRLRVARQLLTESLLLSLLGGGLGIVLAIWGIEAFESIRPDATYRGVKEFRFDRAQDIPLDFSVLAFTLATSLATGIGFGLAPALQAAKVNVMETLKEEGRSASAGRRGRRLRSLLLVIEVAVALVLLTGAGMTIESFYRLTSVDPGLRPQEVLRTELDLAIAQRAYSGNRYQVFDQVLERLRAVPGVISVAAVGEDPLIRSGWQDTVAIEARSDLVGRELPQIDVRVYSPDVFRTLGIPLLKGRDFTSRDVRDATPVCIVNQSAGAQLFAGEDPIGKRIQFRGRGPKVEIVGIVGDVRNFSVDGQSRPETYLPHTQSFLGGAELGPLLLIRTQGPVAGMEQSLRTAVERDAPAARILGDVQKLETILNKSVSQERFVTVLLTGFGAVALILAAVGVYSVMAYSVEQRTYEIGVRMALGAQPEHVFRLVLGQGLLLCTLGIAAGIVLSLATSQLLRTLVYGMELTSPTIYAGVSLLLLAVGALACYLPARRAMAVNPAVALREP